MNSIRVSGIWIFAGLAAVTMASAATDTRLAEAVQASNSTAALSLLEKHVDVNAIQPDGSTALLWAAHNDDQKMAEALVHAGANVKLTNRYGISPLSEAATNGNGEMIKLFLKTGADANTALPEGDTVLMMASRAGNMDSVKALIEHGADVNAKESFHGETALMWAAGENQPEVVRYLAAHGADLNAHAREMQYPDPKSIKQKANATPTSSYPKGGLTALMEAARQNSFEAAQALLDAGADPNQKTPDKMTTLIVAVANSHWDMAALLIEKGADVNDGSLDAAVTVKNANVMRAASHHIEKMTAVDFVRAELAHGAKPDVVLAEALPAKGSQFVNGQLAAAADATPLYRAAKTADYALMQILVDGGADAKITLKDGTTPLMASLGVGGRAGAAGMGGNYGAVEAQESAMMKAAQICLDHGADINAADATGQTALHGVASRGSDRLVQFLADHGAKLDLKDKRDRTALDVAKGVSAGAEGRGGAAAAPTPHPSTAALLRKLMGLPAQESESASNSATEKAASKLIKTETE